MLVIRHARSPREAPNKDTVNAGNRALETVKFAQLANPTPSPDDMALTRRLIDAGRLIGVDVLDHIVIGDGRYVSFREVGWR